MPEPGGSARRCSQVRQRSGVLLRAGKTGRALLLLLEGTVRRAEDDALNRHVAIKTVRFDLGKIVAQFFAANINRKR